MNKILIALGVAGIVAVPALALQQGAAPQRPDRDAPVTRAEVQARVQQRFAAVDANHDGAITKAELDAGREKMKQQRAAGRAERRDRMFAMLDADKNGQISKQEFAAGRPGPGADGMQGRHGMKGMRGGGHGGHGGMGMGMAMRGGMGMGPGWLERLDADKDGKLTLAEASARPLAMFDSADANKDGTVTPEERQAARGMMRRAWNAVRG